MRTQDQERRRQEQKFITISVIVSGLIAFTVFGIAFQGSAQVGEIPTPEGYVPWFSVDGEWLEGNVKIRQTTEENLDGLACRVIVVGSNRDYISPASIRSEESLILPPGTPIPVPGWKGKTTVRQEGMQVAVEFEQPKEEGSGPVTRFSFFIQSRQPFGPCTQPGRPSLVQ